jgi:NAD(P)-dependent dehydrogenase (short-subunit alcohol dehydrogenase family)
MKNNEDDAVRHFGSISNEGAGMASRAAVFLASQDSAWITGESLVIAGGLR